MLMGGLASSTGTTNNNRQTPTQRLNRQQNRSQHTFDEQIEDLLDNFTYLINNERVTLKEERLRLVEEK